MEEREQLEEPQPKREPLFTKSTVIIIVVFAVVNISVVLAVFGGRIFGASGEGTGEGRKKSVLEDNVVIQLGRVEISKALDPQQQNYRYYSANISLVVPRERQQVVEPLIKQNDAIFKELARQAFRNADPQDLAIENLAGVKHVIQKGINDVLGEDAIKQVVFGDYRPY